MKHILRLYVTGCTAHSQTAIKNLEGLCEEALEGQYDIEVIDVLEHPELAEDQKIMATPTLVKELPVPIRKIIGDLSNREKVLLGLDLVPARNSEEEK